MSLRISNKATPKQIQMLKDLEYSGSKWDLTTDEAAQLITELYEQRRMELDSGLDDNQVTGWKD